MALASVVIALVAIGGLASVWFVLRNVSTRVSDLEQKHAPSHVRKAVEVKRVSMPTSAILPDPDPDSDRPLV
jgi:hypothetical protein